MNEIVREFLLETHENLAQLDLDLVRVERDPSEKETLARIFRTVHTVKGTAGFLGFSKLEGVTHAAENLLARVRNGSLVLTPDIATALLGVVDAIRRVVASIEQSETEGDSNFSALVQTLEKLNSTPSLVVAPRVASLPTLGTVPVPPAEPDSVAEPRADSRTQVTSKPAKASEPAPAPTPRPVASPPAPVSAPVSVQTAAPKPEPARDSTSAPAPASDPAPGNVSAPAPLAAPAPPRVSSPMPETSTALPASYHADDSPPADRGEPPATSPAAGIPVARSLVEPGVPDSVEPRVAAVSDSAIRVDVGLLDKLMTLVGELVLARNQIVQYGNSQEDAAFLATVQRLNLLTTELQAGVMKTRMQPIGNIWSKFPRVVRDLALACGKQARIDMDGKDTELDKTIVEAIRDPLTHMVRNAVDHGIEPPAERIARGKPAEGRLSLYASHEGGKVIIEIADDGAGIDPRRVRDKALAAKLLSQEQANRMSERELLDLIFLPGFSTTDKVTNFSGRGVGMDVVRTNVEKIGGTVDLESRLGRGTTVKMKIPLTLAIIPALIISTSGERFAIPQVNLLELVRLEGDQIRKGIELIHGAPVYRLRGNLLPLVYLHRQLQLDAPNGKTSGEVNIVVLQADDRQFGLVVDAIHDTEEIVVKPLQKQIKGLNTFAGVTIMGDGRLALILDVLGLALAANVVSGTRGRVLGEKPSSTPETPQNRQTLLLFTTSDGGRMAIPLAQVARLEEFPRNSLESVGEMHVIQYRNEILPLFHVSQELRRLAPLRGGQQVNPSGSNSRISVPAPGVTESDSVPVVVFADQERRAGLVVGEILDIVDEDLASQSRASRPGVLFNAVVQGRVTEFLDVETVIKSADPDFFQN